LRKEAESLVANASLADGFVGGSALAAMANVVVNPSRS
jgi:hypothetical protein